MALSIEDYLNTSFRPDCDFVDGEIVERNVGLKRHAFAQAEIACWFGVRDTVLGLEPLLGLRLRVGDERVRASDIVVVEIPMPDEDVFTSPPYLCVEILSPEDAMAGMQDRMDDYLRFGVPNIWVVDPWKHRGWRVSAEGWAVATDGIMRTADGRVAMPLADVLLP